MTRKLVNDICKTYPGAEHSDPWGGGHDCWKVGDKIFALIGMKEDRVSIKCDSIETADMLIETGIAAKAPYMHRSWISLPCDAARDELQHRIRQSSLIIRASLPKKVAGKLAPID